MSGESYNNAYSVLENRRLAMRAKYLLLTNLKYLKVL